ncbi:DUF4083 family protein [Peribacillus frigoritolerans]
MVFPFFIGLCREKKAAENKKICNTRSNKSNSIEQKLDRVIELLEKDKRE